MSGGNNPAVAKDGLDLLGKISSQGGFVLQDHLKVGGYPAAGTVRGAIQGAKGAPPATVLISTRFMYGNNARTVSMWQSDYVDTAIHEMLHQAGRYSGYSDTELAVAASKLPGARAGLPAAPTGQNDMNAILNNSGYFDSELKRHCGGK